MNEQHLPVGLAAGIEGRRGLCREADRSRAADSLVVRRELAAEAFGHRRKAFLALQLESIALRRGEAGNLVPGLGDLIVGGRVAEVELNPLLAEQNKLHRTHSASELVNSRNLHAVDVRTRVEVEVVGGLDRARSGDLVDAAILASFAGGHRAVAAVLSAGAAGFVAVAGVVAASSRAGPAVARAGAAVL